ncbi:hypothetical protein C8R42DRAFT_649115 [Lentinula raphanica]|nr:hypothetical protein C8R42DRAFT_649115 [Lentinula raphanica]
MTDKDFDLDRVLKQEQYFESAGLQKAKDEADRLHKTTITLEAEISRLEKLNERLSSKLSEFKAKRKNTTTFGVMTEIPHPISLDNDGPCHASEVPNEFTRTTLQGHSSRDVLVFNGNGLDFEEHSTPLTVTEGHDNDSMARSYPNDKQNQTTASSIIDGEGGDGVLKTVPPSDPASAEHPAVEVVVAAIEYPADAATNKQAMSWLPKAFDYVNVDLGPDFANLVSSWIELERSSQWKTDGQVRLPSTNRPPLLSEWVHKKRYNSSRNEPNLMEQCGEDFALNVKNWWTSLQPEWKRGMEGGKVNTVSPELVTSRKEWENLDKYGINGWFSVLVCLKWWGMNLQGQVTEVKAQRMPEWLKMVNEVQDAMKALIEYRTRS